MKNYTCRVCGEGVLLEPQEVEESGAFCLEHLFSEEFPALKQLADEAGDTEKRPGHPNHETDRAAAESTTHEGAEDMQQSIPPEKANQAVTEIMEFMLGEWAAATIASNTTIRQDVVRNRLAGRGEWTVGEISKLADMMNVKPSRLVSAIFQVAADEQTIGQAVVGIAEASQGTEVSA